MEEYAKDGPDNYEILEQLASSVYRARCKRGRLKNRLIALKKLSLDKRGSPSISLYQTLCHPSLVSLLSAFSTTTHQFQVLELCSGGSLAAFLSSRQDGTLSEEETRSALRSILDALAYLKKNNIVHRNINLENVALTEHCRIKLSSLDSAVQLPSQDFTAITLLTHPEYIAPEFLSRKPYDCSADLWSLGCLTFTCLVGEAPFQGSSIDAIFKDIMHGRYTMPETLSTLATNFITSLIRVDPRSRQDLASIAIDPFLDSRLPDIQLKLSDPTPRRTKVHALPFRAPSSLQLNATNKRPPLQDVQNVDLRRILSDEISLGERRITSDPGVKLKTTISGVNLRSSSLNFTNRTTGTSFGASKRRAKHSSPDSSEREDVHRIKFNEPVNVGTRDQSGADPSHDPLPIGTSRPTPLNTAFLSARAHKTIQGQITILHSRSLLVDFREGERRRGRNGMELLVISPEGDEVKIYSAPDLSESCTLTEPVTIHNIHSLPRDYWVQYNDAASFIGRLKQRTPRMLLHEPTLKCVLMANSPQADVELTFSGPTVDAKRSQNLSGVSSDNDQVYMRLRYSRQMQSLEIAKCVAGPQGQEWKKRDLKISSLDPSSEAFTGLSDIELNGIGHLSHFLHVCEVIEEQRNLDHSKPFLASTPLEHPLIDAPLPNTDTNRIASGTGSRTLAQSLSMSTIDLIPRPQKFRSTSKCQYFEASQDLLNPYQEVEHLTKVSSITPATSPSFLRDGFSTTDLFAPGNLLHTRFIPSVGWCIRYNSKVSQGGRYKVMFLDGEILDVDVDEEWVERIIPDFDGVSRRERRSIRESHLHRALSERMKVFEEFVSMFEPEYSSLHTINHDG